MDQTTVNVTPRRTSGQGWTTIATAVSLAGALSIPPASATAGDGAVRRSELLVPAGWECGPREQDVVTADDELLTPAGWSSQSAARWTGRTSSEVLVPVDWSAHKRTL